MAVRQVTPQEAYDLLAEGHEYVDVRTTTEYQHGHPAGAVNIPVSCQDAVSGQMKPNPDFLSAVEARFAAGTRLVVGCQSGARSQRAAEMLSAAGYAVCNMQGGFGGTRDQTGRVVVQGWAACGLPVETGAMGEKR